MSKISRLLFFVGCAFGNDEDRLIHKASWIEIDRNAFEHNISAIRLLIGPEKKLGVVLKSNAYGHGLLPMARLSEENGEVHYLMTFLLSDALFLRKNGIKKPILVLGCYDDSIEKAILADIDLLVHSWPLVYHICDCATKLRKKPQIHLKVDTGMGRLGFLPEEVLSVVDYLVQQPWISLVGLCSHFSTVSRDIVYTKGQLAKFEWVLKKITERGIDLPLTHIASSPAVLGYPVLYAGSTMVRCGGIMYGLYKESFLLDCARKRVPTFSLQSVLRWKSRIITVKDFPVGAYIGYGKAFKTQRPTRLAVIPVGFYDGYYRRLSNCGYVLVGDFLAPIVGNIAMNMMTVDVTDILDVHEGDEVTLVGNHEGVRARDIALQLKVVEYETMQSLNPHIPRVVV